jgi:hypothetical protein
MHWFLYLTNGEITCSQSSQVSVSQLALATSFSITNLTLKPSGNYMYHASKQSVTLYLVFISSVWVFLQTAINSLNSVNQLIFVMVKYGVLFEVRTGFLNNI